MTDPPRITYTVSDVQTVSSSTDGGSESSLTVEVLNRAYDYIMSAPSPATIQMTQFDQNFHRTEIPATWVSSPGPIRNTTKSEEQRDMSSFTIKAKDLFKEENINRLEEVIRIMSSACNIEKMRLTRQIHEYLQHIDNAVRSSKQMLMDLDKDIVASTNRRIGVFDLQCEVSQLLSEAKNLELTLDEFIDSFKNREMFGDCIFKNLNYLSKDKEDIKITATDRIVEFAFVTDDINLEYDDYKIELGPFEIKIEYRVGRGIAVWANALKPNKSHDGGFHHPHVSGSDICMGDSELTIGHYLMHGMVSETLEVLKILLNTYNPDSPYRTIEEWVSTVECSVCNDDVSSDDIRRCPMCGKYVCEDCSVEFEDTGEVCCENCQTDHRCSSCEKVYRRVIEIECCHELLCYGCRENEAIKCRQCGKLIHIECGDECIECHYLFCNDCIKVDAEDEDELICSMCESAKSEKEEEPKDE